MTPLVEVSGLVQRYDGLQGPEVLRGVDLRVEAGESVAVLGPSGSGKSTLLHVLGALLAPTAGSVRYDGKDLAVLSADALADLRNREIGYVFQAHHLLPQLSALENVLVPTLVHPDAAWRREAPARARALLEQVGLGPRLDHRPAQLSGGECQRVAVVRALINRPRLVLADEPTGSLDGAAASAVGQLLGDLHRTQGVALIAVTHSHALAQRMQRVLELREGKLVPAVAT
jgi:predicted ABC-type transport system involved in lysophospholipase L1 biosynthesis ATPase subunit